MRLISWEHLAETPDYIISKVTCNCKAQEEDSEERDGTFGSARHHFALWFHGGAFFAKNARSPCWHSSVKRGDALALAASSIDRACRENWCRYSFVFANACGPPSAQACANANARSSRRWAGTISLTTPPRTAS